MAFIDQVQDLTSLTVSDNDELSQFLKDGVLDVTNRWLAMKPQDVELFIRVSGEQTANDSLALNGVKIINVIREDGTNNQWRNCRKISPALQYDVTDIDSLNYASRINPAYTLLHNGKINVFPSAAVGGSDSFKVYYVNNEPTDLTNNAALIHSHSDIQYFPADKVYLVVIYAGMKLLKANMGATTISDLSVTAVPPDIPLLSTITFSSIDSAIDSDPSTYLPPAPPDRPDFESSITDEDLELVQMKSQQYQSDISAFQSEMQSEVNKFQAQNQINISNAERSQNRQLQNSINDMKVIYDNNTQLIQKWTQGLAQYQAEIANEVQEYTQNLQADSAGYQWLQGQYAALKAEYDAAFMIAAPKPQPQQQVRR